VRLPLGWLAWGLPFGLTGVRGSAIAGDSLELSRGRAVCDGRALLRCGHPKNSLENRLR